MALNPKKLLIVGVGSLCSALVVIMLLNVALRPKEAPKQESAGLEVMVAAKALKPGEVLDGKMVKWQAWDESRIYDGLVTRKAGEKEDVTGKMKREVAAGEPITTSAMVGDADATLLAAQLKPGMRAVGVRVTAEGSAGGFVMPGDHVDVILSQQIDIDKDSAEATMAAGTIQSEAAETILQNIKVLAIDQNADKNDSAKVGRTATLEVTRKQAEMLLLASQMGDLSLALRGIEDEAVEETPQRPENATTDIEVSRILARLHARNDPSGPVQNVRIYNSVAADSRVYAVQHSPAQTTAAQ